MAFTGPIEPGDIDKRAHADRQQRQRLDRPARHLAAYR